MNVCALWSFTADCARIPFTSLRKAYAMIVIDMQRVGRIHILPAAISLDLRRESVAPS
jgi:hypothetical protein